MIAVAAVLIAFGWYQRPKRWAPALIVSGGVLISPLLAVGATAGFVVVKRWRTIVAKRAASGRRRRDVLTALDLVALATTAGLPFHAAVSLTAREVGGGVGRDLDRAVARVQSGLDHALAPGPVASAFDAAARSAISGARLGDSLVDLSRDVRADEAAAERERIERVPVKLLFPLAFLILPGFVLVAVVPAIVSGLGRLSF